MYTNSYRTLYSCIFIYGPWRNYPSIRENLVGPEESEATHPSSTQGYQMVCACHNVRVCVCVGVWVCVCVCVCVCVRGLFISVGVTEIE